MHATIQLLRQQSVDLLVAVHGTLPLKTITDQRHLEMRLGGRTAMHVTFIFHHAVPRRESLL